MNREEALKQLIDCELMIYDAKATIDKLVEKKQNLRKIVLGELLPPAPEIKRVEKGKRITNKSGETEAIVAKILHDHGGKLSQNEIAELSDLRIGQVNGVIYKLVKKNLVHKYREEHGRVFFSIAVHKDRSELNHL